MPEIPEELLTYFAKREQQRHEQVTAALEARTPAERTLMKEAAVMGYVQGMRAGRDEAMPKDLAILRMVVGACLAMPDLYPAISAIPDTPTEETEAEPTCTACASSPCACKSEVQLALDTLDDLLTAGGGLEALSVDDVDAVDAWANNVQLDIARHRRVRNPCPATFEPVAAGRSGTTHTCDLGASHEPLPHHCPRCDTEWERP